jgi:hypothetical protein
MALACDESHTLFHGQTFISSTWCKPLPVTIILLQVDQWRACKHDRVKH